MKQDRRQALQRATALFWEKGFHATSMRNIQQAIDMRPGSIYATFGSKEGLFRESLQHYVDTGMAQLQTAIENCGSPLGGLKQYMRMSVIDCCQDAPSGLCMLMKTVSELTEDNADLLSEAKRLLVEVETAFAQVLSRAVAAGELKDNEAPATLARYLQVQMIGLRGYARLHPQPAMLDALVDEVFARLPTREQPPGDEG